MPNNGFATVFNSSLHPDSGRDFQSAQWDWWLHLGVAGSAAEHGVLKSFYQTNAISTVKLLQQAGTNTLHLNRSNYLAYGDKVYNGVALKNADPQLWSQATAFFAPGFYDEEVLMTPGNLTNGTYQGAGALLVSFPVFGSLVSRLNGGLSCT